ncbi:MAG TPA: DUF72 domain-containing protein [Gryllotalpicola sp.]
MTDPQARIGAVSWRKPQWRGDFYPPGLPQAEELRYLAGRMRTLEIDTTFYGLQSPGAFTKWRDQVPQDFVFSVKGIGTVTHERRLESVARNVAEFLASGVLLLGEKLGPILWQLPPSLPFQPAKIDAFLGLLPRSVDEARRFVAQQGIVAPMHEDVADGGLRHALEARHHSFGNNPRFLELLRRHDVAAVITNSDTWPRIDAVTAAGFVYVRLHADMTQFPDGYDDETLDWWAERITAWRTGAASADGNGRDVFAYFDHSGYAGTRSPYDAIRLQRRLGGPGPQAGTTLQPALW